MVVVCGGGVWWCVCMVCKPNLVKPFAQGFSFGLVPGPSLSICHCTKKKNIFSERYSTGA